MSNSYDDHEVEDDFELVSLGEFALDEGGVIPDLELAVATWGTLNENRDNAILVTTWYSGSHREWGANYIGSDHALDPDKYFIVAINQIGNGFSTSGCNAVGVNAPIAGPNFPLISISDDVRAQQRVLSERFGIERLQLVVGGSMGGVQVWEWLVRFPDRVLRGAPIAGTARTTPHNAMFAKLLADQLRSDPAWNDGEYEESSQVSVGLLRHSQVLALMGLSPEFWKRELWRGLGCDSREAFQRDFLDASQLALDPNSLLTMSWKWQQADVARMTGGDLAAALGRITAKVFVLAVDTDTFFTAADMRAEQELTPRSEMKIVHDAFGHLALFGVSGVFVPWLDECLTELLASS